MAKTKGPAGVSCSQPAPPSASALIICRNKHWRYISSFHGPWLQLPPEILESLAHSNYQAPRPRPIHPAVFYDLVNIRKAVDEATNLAVRATSGLTSAALSSQANAANGILGSAAQLGLGYVGAGHNTKLSRERKYRMRELATQKLSHAYRLDEIAASVATMQSASTLEDVAHLVLQRSTADADAKYVHFFHEKIPSRMMAEYTPLDPLNDIISERPSDGSPLRTRALTRLFKDDYIGAARDLTDGLAVARYAQQQHRAGNDQLVLAKTARGEAEARRANPREWRDPPVKDEDQPSSLETQLLFHRAGVYLTMACQHVHAALEGIEARRKAQKETLGPGAELPPLSPGEKEAHRVRLENRKLVKTYAKRALRDYVAFLSHLDYTPGLDPAIAEAFLHKVNDASNGVRSSKSSYRERVQELTDSPSKTNRYSPDALVPHQKENSPKANAHVNWSLPPPDIYQLSALFSSTPPANLPTYPSSPHVRPDSKNTTINAFAESQEAVTYHPLLTDALHSLLLCHALVQTPPTELRRHAHNVARVARICDGYPIFLAARSPARADWIEVLRRASNWIELTQSWEQLCRPAPLPGTSSSGSSSSSSGGSTSSAELLHTAANATTGASGPRDADEAEAQRRERKKHEAILDALADERVVDEESFQRVLRARGRRDRGDEEQNVVAAATAATAATAVDGLQTDGQQPQTQKRSPQQPEPKRWAQEDGKEYPVSTERAEVIARWVREAPLSVREGGKKRKGKKGARRKEGAKTESKEELEWSVEGERVSEKIDE
ncbi:hypothetical protein MPH_06048 [Macrophomina phaseolina MS6]|uniref:Histidine kinase group protein n=1 Tax=Macrophomina phaseolina (strain MS6) TaxID=1126212 RepID=K2RVH0_MACPH|nr:hypothetical protein MPH_06048 [Macrophomina phaseolina MS6]